jgi:hypothetical protein
MMKTNWKQAAFCTLGMASVLPEQSWIAPPISQLEAVNSLAKLDPEIEDLSQTMPKESASYLQQKAQIEHTTQPQIDLLQAKKTQLDQELEQINNELNPVDGWLQKELQKILFPDSLVPMSLPKMRGKKAMIMLSDPINDPKKKQLDELDKQSKNRDDERNHFETMRNNRRKEKQHEIDKIETQLFGIVSKNRQQLQTLFRDVFVFKVVQNSIPDLVQSEADVEILDHHGTGMKNAGIFYVYKKMTQAHQQRYNDGSKKLLFVIKLLSPKQKKAEFFALKWIRTTLARKLQDASLKIKQHLPMVTLHERFYESPHRAFVLLHAARGQLAAEITDPVLQIKAEEAFAFQSGVLIATLIENPSAPLESRVSYFHDDGHLGNFTYHEKMGRIDYIDCTSFTGEDFLNIGLKPIRKLKHFEKEESIRLRFLQGIHYGLGAIDRNGMILQQFLNRLSQLGKHSDHWGTVPTIAQDDIETMLKKVLQLPLP